MNIDTPNRNSVQTISPTLGLTRKLPPLSSAAKMTVERVIGLEEEGDQARHEPVEEARLGEREAEPLDAGDLVAHLRLTRDRLDDLAEDDADADARATAPRPPPTPSAIALPASAPSSTAAKMRVRNVASTERTPFD